MADCQYCKALVLSSAMAAPHVCDVAALRAQLAARDAEVTRLRDLLSRYYREVPLGHQPHMIAHLAEAALKGEG